MKRNPAGSRQALTKRVRTSWAPLVLALVASLGQAQPVSGQADAQVLLTPAQALLEVFPGAAHYRTHEFTPSAGQRSQLEETLGRRLFEPRYSFFVVYDASDRHIGYALVTDERGKYRPITFMVGIRPDFSVSDAAVMVYRESRGGEVQRERFLAQYRGKTLRDPIQINRDIINISGATISVRSLNAGVRKALAVAQVAFAAGAPPAAELRPIASLR